jgi:hypothetical protein
MKQGKVANECKLSIVEINQFSEIINTAVQIMNKPYYLQKPFSDDKQSIDLYRKILIKLLEHISYHEAGEIKVSSIASLMRIAN